MTFIPFRNWANLGFHIEVAMRTIHSKPAKALTALMLAAMTALLASCGGSGLTTTTGTGTGTTAGTPSITLALTNPTTGAATSSTPATVRATVLSATGAAVANVVVTFSADATVATMSPSTGTALTDASGVATISLNAASSTAGGASTLTANATVSGTATSASIGFQVNAAATTTGVSFTNLTVGANPLSAYGTTSVTATVTPATPPVTVTFSSTCASTGKATLSSTVTTVGGVATGSYLDNGCGSTDTITASVAGTTATTSTTLVVTPPATGSLKYVSASPAIISLQGTGGTSSSTVTFMVVDSGGNPISGKVVTFGLSTTLGGITFTPNVAAPTATSNAQGLVSIIVNAGTMSTPVRVTASTCTTGDSPCTGTTLTTQSNQLTITTGIPDQDSFSLAATTLNSEGWNIDGLTSTLTARLSDHFNNPVPDGTAVNFTTEGGSVIGSCTTTNGACTSTFTTQQPRPTNGRVTVLAFAIGEESFTDLNGNGVADLSPNEMIDANGASTDMAEAFVDYNENGAFDAATEPYEDFNGDGIYNAADSKYNGVLCDNATAPPKGSSAGTCSTTKSIHVRRALVLTMSSSTPAALALFNNAAPPAAATSINLPACDNTVGGVSTMDATTYYVRVVDVNGNAMPVGTTIGFATTNGTLLSTASFTTMNNTGCSSAFPGCPAGVGTSTFEYYPVTLQSDATITPATATTPATCNNTKTSGLLTVTVRTPGGSGIGSTTTTTSFVVTD